MFRGHSETGHSLHHELLGLFAQVVFTRLEPA